MLTVVYGRLSEVQLNFQIRLLDEPWYEDSVEKKGAGGVAFLSVV